MKANTLPTHITSVLSLEERKIWSDRHSVTIEGPSLTVQSQALDTDLNVLMERFGITGQMPQSPRIPMYGDFTGINDYRSAIEAIRAADEAFMELPAKVRAEFENNPQLLLEAAATPGNAQRFKDLGLIKEVPQPPAPPQTPPQVPQTPASGTT